MARKLSIMFKWFKKRIPSIPNTWATFEIGHVVCRWTRPDGKERVYLIARRDGDFSCGNEYFSEDENEMCWISQGAGSVFASEEIAVREIHGLFPWAREVVCENKMNN
jgi:hypothetical protein